MLCFGQGFLAFFYSEDEAQPNIKAVQDPNWSEVPFWYQSVKLWEIFLREFVDPKREEDSREHVNDVMNSAWYDQQHDVRKPYTRNVFQGCSLPFFGPEHQTEEHNPCVSAVKVVASDPVRNPDAGWKSGFIPVDVWWVRKLDNVLNRNENTKKMPLMP